VAYRGKIYLGADHAGFDLKEEIRRFLVEQGYDVADVGANRKTYDDDYPDYMRPVAEQVAGDKGSRGILFGGSGQGEAMVANRISGARAAVWYGKNDKIVALSREHNDANILSIGARFVSTEEAKRAVALWLETPFSYDPRHERRVDKIDIV
jgi:ribose 5-phosphate isomerase B